MRDRRRLGEVLVELELIDANGLEDAVAFHVHEMLAKIFLWHDGTFAFAEVPEAEAGSELTLKLSTGELILEAVQAVQRPRRRALLARRHGPAAGALLRPPPAFPEADPVPGGRLRPLARGREHERPRDRPDDPAARGAGPEEPPRPRLDRRRRVPGGPSRPKGRSVAVPGASLPKRAPRPRRAKRLRPPPDARGAPALSSGAGSSSRGARLLRPACRRRLPRPPSPPLLPRQPPRVRPPDAAAEKAAERRREILETFEGLKAHTHFEVLGLPRSVGEAEVKDAYFRLAKRFHPDVHHGPELGDLRDKLEAVFIRLGEAYDVLRDPRKRADYEERLGRSKPKPARGDAARPRDGTESAPPEPPPDPAEAARLAEEDVRRAAKLVEQEKYWDAIQLLEPAVRGRRRARHACEPACCSPAPTSGTRSGRRAPRRRCSPRPGRSRGRSSLGLSSGASTRRRAAHARHGDVPQGARAEARSRGGRPVSRASTRPPPEPPEDEGGGEGGRAGSWGGLFRKG